MIFEAINFYRLKGWKGEGVGMFDEFHTNRGDVWASIAKAKIKVVNDEYRFILDQESRTIMAMQRMKL